MKNKYNIKELKEKINRCKNIKLEDINPDEFMRKENRWFVAEKDVKCDEMYDLTGIVKENNISYRGYK